MTIENFLQFNKSNAQYKNIWVYLILKNNVDKIDKQLENSINKNNIYKTSVVDYNVEIKWKYEINTNDLSIGFIIQPTISQLNLKYDVLFEYSNEQPSDTIQNEVVFQEEQIQSNLIINETSKEGINICIESIQYNENNSNVILVEWRLL